jgi:hypothetical protein
MIKRITKQFSSEYTSRMWGEKGGSSPMEN